LFYFIIYYSYYIYISFLFFLVFYVLPAFSLSPFPLAYRTVSTSSSSR